VNTLTVVADSLTNVVSSSILRASRDLNQPPTCEKQDSPRLLAVRFMLSFVTI